MSPSPLDFGFREYLQDYDTWVKDGYADIVSPQLYRRDDQGILGTYRGLLSDQIGRVGTSNKDKFLSLHLRILGSYAPNDQLCDMIFSNRANGITGELTFSITH